MALILAISWCFSVRTIRMARNPASNSAVNRILKGACVPNINCRVYAKAARSITPMLSGVIYLFFPNDLDLEVAGGDRAARTAQKNLLNKRIVASC